MIVRKRWWKWSGPGFKELPGTEVAIIKLGVADRWGVYLDGRMVATAESLDLAKKAGEALAGGVPT